MTVAADSLHNWLREQVAAVLAREAESAPLMIWCDPDREWLEMLRVMSDEDGFELWADPEEHELAIRDRFYSAEPRPRVVWLPRRREDISWFKVFELQAASVWEKSLLQGLRDYGVDIPRADEDELLPLLPAHAREWFDNPKETWRELTPGTAKGTLVDDYRMLQVIAGESGEFEQLRQKNRFDIFVRRAVEDFGLPNPTNMGEDEWRMAATARLLVTEAADAVPTNPPSEQDKIIPEGLQRERALKLLRAWQENINFIASFERLSKKADSTLTIAFWARNLAAPPKSKSSRAVEEALFKGYAEKLERISEVDVLNKELEQHLPVFLNRQSGFWSQQARDRIGWPHLVTLAEAASLLVENSSVEDGWKSVRDAVDWYVARGWQLDSAGEGLFQEASDMPQELQRIKARVRRSYLRTADRIGRAFSELLANDPASMAEMPTSGEAALRLIESESTHTALVFIDALRFDLGARLAEMLNTGEPVQRATVSAAVAPIPSVTALGMAFALPISREGLRVELEDASKGFSVFAADSDGDLSAVANRRKWLTATFDVKTFYTINDIVEGQLKPAGRQKAMVVVEGSELDKAGHPGDLHIFGATELLGRYATAIRRLRECGYNRVIVVTDHGFFHWQPEDDEVEEAKPSGDVLWSSRRAIVGRHLSHASGLVLDVPQSDFKAVVPRSTNAFKTYGGLGFFHGGATLQELVIPVVTARWPAKASKVGVVLKPVVKVTSETPRVQVQCSASAQQGLFGADENTLARQVTVKIQERDTGKLVFRHDVPVTVEANENVVTVQLKMAEPKQQLDYGSPLTVLVLDADDEEILAREDVQLKVDIDEW